MTRLTVVRAHACRPAPACPHDTRWSCPDCGQDWIVAGDRTWVTAQWLDYPRAATRETT